MNLRQTGLLNTPWMWSKGSVYWHVLMERVGKQSTLAHREFPCLEYLQWLCHPSTALLLQKQDTSSRWSSRKNLLSLGLSSFNVMQKSVAEIFTWYWLLTERITLTSNVCVSCFVIDSQCYHRSQMQVSIATLTLFYVYQRISLSQLVYWNDRSTNAVHFPVFKVHKKALIGYSLNRETVENIIFHLVYVHWACHQ